VAKKTISLIIALIIPLTLSSNALAEEIAYVTSDLAISLRKTAEANAPTIRGLKSGSRFTVIERDNGSDLAHIRLDDGAEGWIQSRHISKTPNQLQQQLTEAQTTIDKLRTELQQTQSITTAPQPEFSPETNSAALAEENNALKAKITQLESERQSPKPQGGTLSEMSDRDWFLTGTGVMVLGIIIGLIVPRLRLRRRSEWGDL
jgi:SH3 domain protein